MISHKGTQIIHTERLLLRKYDLKDVGDIFENYATDERVTKFLSWEPYENIETLESFVAAQVSAYSDAIYNWVIEYNRRVIGSISVTQIDNKNESCEIGYCIGCNYWNKGIMTEAVSAVLKYLFVEAGFHRVFAKHDVENPASGIVMQKCNMLYEGKLREQYRRHDGTFSDSLIYSILINEFGQTK